MPPHEQEQVSAVVLSSLVAVGAVVYAWTSSTFFAFCAVGVAYFAYLAYVALTTDDVVVLNR